MLRLLLPTTALLALLAARATWADDSDRLKVGVQPDGRIVVPTNQVLQPAGTQVAFPGRPVDLVLVDGGRTVVVKNLHDLVVLDAATGAIRQTLTTPVGRELLARPGAEPKDGPDPPRLSAAQERQPVGFSVVGMAAVGDRVYVSDVRRNVHVAVRQPDDTYAWGDPLPVPIPNIRGEPHPAGLALAGDGRLAVTATRANAVHFLDPATGKVAQTVAVGVAPYFVLPVGRDRAYVSNWGGDRPGAGDRTVKSSGTATAVDERGIADRGSVSVLAKSADGWKASKSIAVGLHPSGMAASAGGRFVYVANAASDTVSVLDVRTDAVVETIPCRPEARLPFGSGTNAVALSPDGGTLYVANGTNNCVAVVRLGRNARDDGAGPERSELLGLIPTGWYPGAVAVSADGKRLFVANVKGHGSLSRPRAAEKGMNTHDHLGTVSVIDVPDAATLARLTARVNDNNRLAYSLAGLEKPRPDAKPVPVPARHGEPSVFEHVVYVIKENRTYDQVLGDMEEGNGDPKLCIFGEEVTPNHHKLAREFTLFDNFYCSGVLSADGHQWVNEAYVTDYLEKAFGGFTRSYPYEGSDPLAFASSGFLWDNALSRKRTLRNYGEFVRTSYVPKAPTWTEAYAAFQSGNAKFAIQATPNVARLGPYTHPAYPSFQMNVPDVLRAKVFIDELKQFEAKSTFPNLVYLFLPCDHTSGTRPAAPTPRAMVADNDLALGRCIEALSKSKFWPKTCVFVVEDDPQNGFDHVDAHRTVALVISPYTKRKFVDSTCYNQTGMVKTIELLLGLPPMNQLDLSATAMRDCFQAAPDPTPYAAVPNRIPLDEMNRPTAALRGRALEFARKSLELDFDEADQADEDTLNRILWHSVRGDAPYPKDMP